MSFALEFRRKHFIDKTTVDQTARKASIAEAVAAHDVHDDYVPDAGNVGAGEVASMSRRVGGALAVAGLVLALLNSAALTRYVNGLQGDGALVESIIAWSQSWHDEMDGLRLTEVERTIRDNVMAARETSWQDIRGLTGLPAGHAIAGMSGGLTPRHGFVQPEEMTGSLPDPQADAPLDDGRG